MFQARSHIETGNRQETYDREAREPNRKHGYRQLGYQVLNQPAGANTVTLSVGGASATATFNIVPVEPGIFVYGNNLAVAQNQDYTLNDASHPANAGSYVTVYLTGIGPPDNPVYLGDATPSQP